MAEAHEVKIEDNELQILFPGRKAIYCSPGVDIEKYANWPKSFQNIIKHHEYLAYPETGWSLNLGDVGSFESEYLEDVNSELLEYVDAPEDILCPITDYSDWWLYHPKEKNPSTEPSLCYLNHEGGDIEDPITNNLGSYFLTRIAEDLELKVTIPKVLATVENEEELLNWYQKLTAEWEFVIKGETSSEGDPSASLLQKLLKSKDIYIGDSEIKTLIPLKKFSRIKELTAFNCNITSLDGIQHLTGLKELKLHNTNVSNFEILKNFPKLKKLGIGGTKILSIKELPLLTKLKELEIDNTAIENLEGIERFSKLEDLEFDNTSVSNLEPLGSLKKIDQLSFSDTKVQDLSPIYGKKKIYILSFQNTPVPLNEILSFNASISKNTDEMSSILGISIYADATKNNEAFVQAISELSEISKDQYETLALLTNNKLISTLKSKKYLEAHSLLSTFLNLNNITLSEAIQTELAGNALVLTCLPEGRDLVSKVFEVLIPKEVKERRLAFNLACWFAAENDKDNLLKYTSISLKLGYEAERFKDKDFSNYKYDKDFISLYSKPQFPDPNVDPEKWFSHLDKGTQDIILWETGDKEPDFTKILNIEKLTHVRDLKSLEPFRYLTKLKELHIEYSSFSSIEPLANLRDLEELELNGDHYITNKKISNINALAKLGKLRMLKIKSHEVKDISVLKNLRNLEDLGLFGNEITDIFALAGLSKLKDLDLRNNKIEDLSIISNLTELEHLDVMIPGYSNFEFIRELKKLTNVWAGTEITSLEVFENLPNLIYLHPVGRKIGPNEAKEFQKNHPDCNLSI